ncbi:50S ribosomal protein L23 [Candidatus Pacearchaeota archaeon]|jgi:ribosomal protein L23|nr:50S ribosomal protein L23 [Candidatus Pacearchaeota archaeon]|tara:strand:+ start:31 stop:273 length:243 start_codon:yes stop_codon:yes gene_type:complete
MTLRPVTSEKAVRLIELNNTLVFEVDKRRDKKDVKKEIEESFKVKVDSMNSLIRNNKKYFYVKLNGSDLAIDVATKLGMI